MAVWLGEGFTLTAAAATGTESRVVKDPIEAKIRAVARWALDPAGLLYVPSLPKDNRGSFEGISMGSKRPRPEEAKVTVDFLNRNPSALRRMIDGHSRHSESRCEYEWNEKMNYNLFELLSRLGKEASNLVKLDLWELAISRANLETIFSKCTKLKHLSFDSESIFDYISEDSTIDSIDFIGSIDPMRLKPHIIKRLTGVTLQASSDKELNETLKSLSPCLPRLRRLCIQHTNSLTHVPSFPHVEEFGMFCCRGVKDIGNLPAAKKVRIFDCPSLEQAGSFRVAKVVDLSHCRSFKKIGDLPRVESLRLGSIGNKSMEFGRMPKLIKDEVLRQHMN